MPQLQQIMEALNQFAPWDLAESWDNVGLQVGSYDKSVSKVIVALDLNEQVIQEGLNHQVDGFVVHHPLLFKPLSAVNLGTPVGRCLEELIKHRFFLIAAHTNADKAADGLNQYLADEFGLTDIKLLEPCANIPSQRLYKIVVFTPHEYVTTIRNAMVQAGAGVIGNYTDCSFEIKGGGTFRPGNQAMPFIGKSNELSRVDEIRLEMLVPEGQLPKVSEAVRAQHPYEEPVIDVYPIHGPEKHGMGRVGKLKEPLPFQELCLLVKQKLSAKDIRATGEFGKMIHSLAICSGSGGSLLGKVLKSKADAFLTGELNYHDFLLAKETNLAAVAAGHWATEHGFVDLIVRYFNDYFQGIPGCEFIPSKALQNEPYISL
jgi:dinuclear metal center YbgI/SA1388 family protein